MVEFERPLACHSPNSAHQGRDRRGSLGALRHSSGTAVLFRHFSQLQTVEWNMDRLMMSPMLLNLVKTYAYNRQKLVHVPMSTAQAELTAKAASDLSTTLKTILRI